MVLVMPLQQTNAYFVACKFHINKPEDFCDVYTGAAAVKEAWKSSMLYSAASHAADADAPKLSWAS